MGKKTESSKVCEPTASAILSQLLPKARWGTENDEKTDVNKHESQAHAGKRRRSTDWRTGSWRGKASAVAGITQSISAAAGATSETIQAQIPIARTAAPQFRSLRSPSKSAASISPPTCLSVSANGQDATDEFMASNEVKQGKDIALEHHDEHPGESSVVEQNEVIVSEDNKETERINTERPLPQAYWGGWWLGSKNSTITEEKQQKDRQSTDEPTTTSKLKRLEPTHPTTEHDIPINQPAAETPVLAPSQGELEELRDTGISMTKSNSNGPNENRSSWFGLWGNSTGTRPQEGKDPSKDELVSSDGVRTDDQAEAEASKLAVTAKSILPSNTAPLLSLGSGSWTFWSREQSQSTMSVSNPSEPQVGGGEAALAKPENATHASSGTKTEYDGMRPSLIENENVQQLTGSVEMISGPEAAKRKAAECFGTVDDDTARHVLLPSADIKDRIAPAKSAMRDSGNSTPNSQAGFVESDKSSVADPLTLSGEKQSPKVAEKLSASKPQLYPNLVLPAFHDTFQVSEVTTYWEQFRHMLGRGTEPDGRHVTVTHSPPRIKYALAIGVHGLFPHPLMQKVFGPPTGTSVNFSNSAANAIQKWTSKQGYSCEIEKIALEGEGLIVDRVDILWKLLLNRLDDIRKAEFIMIACHSQGVMVATILMAKLINLGCLDPSVRLGICGMAGVSLGPFPSWLGNMFGQAANELFNFSIPTSPVSTVYLANLRTCLTNHVRISYTGSLDDQLVSLESAVFATVSHPYIYRTLFVDGRIHAPDFLIRLIGFAMKLRNLGISDHGLIRELSTPVQGSLYSGAGHSQVYKHHEVYDCAVEFALESMNLPDSDVGALMDVKGGYEVPGANGISNPFILPFAMRGVLEERAVRDGELHGEMQELLKLFEEWKPITKPLKDVKYRLEAVRSQF